MDRALAERMGSAADPAFLIQKVGAKGQPPQDLAGGDDLPDAGAGPRFNTQTVDAAVRWQVPEDGLYQILISDLYASQRGHPRLTYRLVIRREQPDFSVVLLPNSPTGADAVTMRAGGRTSAYVAAIRTDGFAGAIRDRSPRLTRRACVPRRSRSERGRRLLRSSSKRPKTPRPRWRPSPWPA